MFKRNNDTKAKQKFKKIPESMQMESLLCQNDDVNNGIDTLNINYTDYFYPHIRKYADEHGVESLPSEVFFMKDRWS